MLTYNITFILNYSTAVTAKEAMMMVMMTMMMAVIIYTSRKPQGEEEKWHIRSALWGCVTHFPGLTRLFYK